jgi:hypothetical protein
MGPSTSVRNPGGPENGPQPGRRPGRLGWLGGWLVACVLLSGCAAPEWNVASLTPDYHPDNVFLYAPGLSPDLKRVVMLPLACEDHRPDLEDGCEALSPILKAELVKSRKFEVVCASPEALQNAMGHPAWTGTEELPPEFFDSLREVYACDAVLFCQLTVFLPYPPLAVGWRLKLVNARTRQTLWATDELLDAGMQSVINGAEGYQRGGGLHLFRDERDEWLMSHSFRRFGQYAAAQVLQTLPNR